MTERCCGGSSHRRAGARHRAATNIAGIARGTGIDTINEFFEPAVARRVREERGPASYMVGCNVVAHIAGPERDDGGCRHAAVAGRRVPARGALPAQLLERAEFDTIYHEHFFYFSLTALAHVLERHGLRIFDVELFPAIHGGSIRVSVCHASAGHAQTQAAAGALEREVAAGVGDFGTYARSGIASRRSARSWWRCSRGLRRDGKRIAAYGAAAKGNTLLNYCGIGPDLLEYVADKSPLKQGLYTPGMHVPVVKASRLAADQPDYTLILAWNMADEIVAEQQAYRAAGGRFIVPIRIRR